MSGIDFEPKTSQLGIPGTSYSVQIGKVNGKWAIRLMKGKTVVDVLIYDEDDLEGGFPNQDVLTNWVLRTVIIPGINPLQIKKTIQFLLKEVKDRKDNMRIKVPIKEAMDVKLKHVAMLNKVPNRKPDTLRTYKCPCCEFKIVHCPKCGNKLMGIS